ncbi:hypothetical protein EI067_15355 [Mycobacterium paragordonae]|uniref:hypothetical protein n=1 Tax=Mycobacterium paragordonae TaxID=1389713 RepID=UPI0010617288|nr:hypothetical protein [Mycobacterium paragordonae]TDK96478.1 hypothetical protein EI067_15355 [Mycobacterium paragordonae]
MGTDRDGGTAQKAIEVTGAEMVHPIQLAGCECLPIYHGNDCPAMELSGLGMRLKAAEINGSGMTPQEATEKLARLMREEGLLGDSIV